MRIVESRDAFPAQADPSVRELREYPLSEVPTGYVVSQLRGRTARDVRLDELRPHMDRITTAIA